MCVCPCACLNCLHLWLCMLVKQSHFAQMNFKLTLPPAVPLTLPRLRPPSRNHCADKSRTWTEQKAYRHPLLSEATSASTRHRMALTSEPGRQIAEQTDRQSRTAYTHILYIYICIYTNINNIARKQLLASQVKSRASRIKGNHSLLTCQHPQPYVCLPDILTNMPTG